MLKKGFLIAIEGLDGTGKTTQAKLLCNHLKKSGFKSETISFPSRKNKVGNIIKNYLRGKGKEAENIYFISSMFAIDRYLLSDKIRRLLSEKYIVILDRYVYSNIAYGGAKFKDKRKFNEFKKFILKFEYDLLCLPKQDITIYLKLPLKECIRLKRTKAFKEGKKLDIYERDKRFLAKAKRIYDDNIKKLGDEVVILDIYDKKNNRVFGKEIVLNSILRKLEKRIFY